jgi:hypothetical protein
LIQFIEKVDLVGYDPVGRMMKDLISRGTGIEKECIILLMEIQGNLGKNWNWFYQIQQKLSLC